jgi:CRISPR-associated protein Csb1
LLFGLWDSTGPRGGLGVKFQRAIVGELVAINAVTGVKSASRLDPTGIVREKEGSGSLSTLIYTTAKAHVQECGDWTLDPEKAEKKSGKPVPYGKEGKPSEANLGNVTPDLKDKNNRPYHGGVTFDYALQTTVISLAALRKLRFPVEGHNGTDSSARTALAALGLAAAILSNAKGASLRSRCDLVPEPNGATWEIVKADGTTETFALSPEDACTLLTEAIAQAKASGLPWREEPLTLLPSDGLAELVRRSRLHASQKKGE